MKKLMLAAMLAGTVGLAHAGDAPFKDIPAVKNDTTTGSQVEVIGDLVKTLSPHHFMLKDKKGRIEIIAAKALQGSDLLRPGIRADVIGKVARSNGSTRVIVSKILAINGARPDLMNIHKSAVFKDH